MPGEIPEKKIVGAQLRKFAESTSVRGIPRVLKSNDRGLHVLWSIAVVTCTSLLVWQLSQILVRYYSYDVVTSFQEAGYNTVFPDLTICKVVRLNTLYTDKMSYSSYIADTLSRKARWPLDRVQTLIPNITEDDYNTTWSYFLSKDGFYNSLPLDMQQTQNDESTNNPFAVYCYASMWDDSTPWNCSEVFPIVWHRKYYKCRSLQIPDSIRRIVRSVSIVVYLNDFDQPVTRDGCCPNEDRSQASGIRLSVHDHGVPTDMTRGIAVSPGSEATIILTETDRQRLPTPYGNCTTSSSLGEPRDKLRYSVHGCQQICLQNTSLAACQCVDLQNRYTSAQLSSVSNTICGNQTTANEIDVGSRTPEADLQAFKTSHCLLVGKKADADQCTCFNPCKERSYDATVSTASPWPDLPFQQDFYDRFIKKTTYAYKFKPYEYIMEAYNKYIYI